MDIFTVTSPVRLFAGRIGLTDAQAKKRMRCLKPISPGVYDIIGMIEFKAGEEIRLEAIPKGLASSLAVKANADPAPSPDGENPEPVLSRTKRMFRKSEPEI